MIIAISPVIKNKLSEKFGTLCYSQNFLPLFVGSYNGDIWIGSRCYLLADQ